MTNSRVRVVPVDLNIAMSTSSDGLSENILKIIGEAKMAAAVIAASATSATLEIAFTAFSSPSCMNFVNRGTRVAAKIPPRSSS